MNTAAYIDIVGGIAGTLTTISFFPQVIKVVKTKSTQDLSLGMFLLFSLGVLLWCAFGFLIGSVPIIITNIVTLLASMIILGYKIKYG